MVGLWLEIGGLRGRGEEVSSGRLRQGGKYGL